MALSKNEIPAYVIAVNRVHCCIGKMYEQLSEFFKPHLNQKVLLKDGSLIKALKDLRSISLPKMHIYHDHNHYTLLWHVSTNEFVNDRNTISYYNNCYIANLDNTILTSLYDPPNNRCDYTVDEIVKRFETFIETKEAFDKAKKAMSPFECPYHY